MQILSITIYHEPNLLSVTGAAEEENALEDRVANRFSKLNADARLYRRSSSTIILGRLNTLGGVGLVDRLLVADAA